MTIDKPDIVRVAIVEDNQIVRESLAEQIQAVDGLTLAGTAESISSAAALITLGADVFLLDLGLPDGEGSALSPHIKVAGDAKIIVLTSFGDRDTVVRTIEAGADGYLLKDSSTADILAAISAALDGGAPISAAAAVHLLERLRAGPDLAERGARKVEIGASGDR